MTSHAIAIAAGLVSLLEVEGHHHLAIQQALAVVGQAVNPVKVVGSSQIQALYAGMPGVRSPGTGLNAFRAPGNPADPYIYVNEESAIYRTAVEKPSPLALLALAATLVHEHVHDTDSDLAAYRVQSDFVRSRLSSLPRQQRQAGRAYLERLDAKAQALAYAVHRQRMLIAAGRVAAARARASRS